MAATAKTAPIRRLVILVLIFMLFLCGWFDVFVWKIILVLQVVETVRAGFGPGLKQWRKRSILATLPATLAGD